MNKNEPLQALKLLASGQYHGSYKDKCIEKIETVLKAFEILNKTRILCKDVFYKMEEKKFINHEECKLLVKLFD